MKQGGINFRNPVEGADAVFASSEATTASLGTSLLDGTDLEPVTHRGQVRAASVEARKEKVETQQATVERMKVNAPKKVIKRLDRIGQCGIWLSIPPNKLSGTCLSFDEFMDALRMRYGLKPLGLCNVCDACNSTFTVAHALSCKKGGLVSIRHNDVRDEAGALASHALQASKVTYEPMINNGRELNDAAQRRRTQSSGNQAGKEARGDVLVYGLWETGTSCVLDVCISDTDQPSYKDDTSLWVGKRHLKMSFAYP